MCCRGAKKDLGLSVAASAAKVWGGVFYSQKQANQFKSNQLASRDI